MGKPIDWLPLVPAALASLRASDAPLVDRATLQKLLQLERRTALRLLSSLGAQRVGTNFVIERETLLAALASTLPAAAGPAPRPSQTRRTHRDAEAFRFPDVRTPERRRADQLPAAIQVAPGQVTIEVADLRDLCAQLWVLLETIQDDRETLEARLAAPARPGGDAA